MSSHARTEELIAGHLAGAEPSRTSPPGIAVEPKPFLCRWPVRLTIYACFALLFIAMLQKLLKVYATAKVIHVVLDNFKIHDSKQVRTWLEEHGARFRLHFLPPYCPDDNKIERA